ncbi:hypothetical protein KW798_00865 [Candidatus Parcubacteria bacterium]|nr:hypothetical protein [Candidatus Parcubacteria bacterium]
MAKIPHADQYQLPLNDVHPRIAERRAEVQSEKIADHLPNQRPLEDILDPDKFNQLFGEIN